MKSKQTEFDNLYLDFCESLQRLSNGAKYKVGAVLVMDSRPLVNGYNGTPPGYPNGTDLFDFQEVWQNETKRVEHREWSSKFEIHAEMNALMYAARKGIPVEGSTLYCSMQPCHNCLKHMLSAGVKRVVYRYKHRSFDYEQDTISMINHCNVSVEHIGPDDVEVNTCKTVQ